MSSIYLQNESTAARRRVYVYLVDATDGITPETGEAGGQPQVSKAGGAWANTTATLTAVGNGTYYVELTATELNTIGELGIRYKSTNTAEFFANHTVKSVDQLHTNYSQQMINGTERIHFTLVTSAGVRATGQAGSITGKISITGGNAVATAGTFTEIDATDSPGEYYYTLDASEVPAGGSRGLILLHLSGAGFATCTVGTQVAIPTSTSVNPATISGSQTGEVSITKDETTASLRRVYLTILDYQSDRKTGVTLGTFTAVKISKAGGAAVAVAGTFTEIDSVDAPGEYYYEATAGEVNTAGPIVIYFQPSVGYPFTLLAEVTSAVDAGAVADAVWDELKSGHTVPDSFGDYLDTKITSRSSAAVATLIQADTDDIQSRIPAALVGGRMDSSVGAMAANVLTAAATAADFGTELATAVWDFVVEGTTTARQAYRGFIATLFGKANGFNTGTRNYRDLADTKNRVQATTDSTGRTSVALDLT